MRAKLYVCDDCGNRAEFTSYVKARLAEWAVAKDYSKCYCPACAPAHRKGAANKVQYVQTCWQQLTIDLK